MQAVFRDPFKGQKLFYLNISGEKKVSFKKFNLLEIFKGKLFGSNRLGMKENEKRLIFNLGLRTRG
jgi:hypothetical protein